MTPGFPKFTLLVIITLVIGFFILWDLQKRQIESLGFENGKETMDAVPIGANEVVIPVEGMTCLSCEITIERALGDLDGVFRVDASVEDKTVYAWYLPDRVSLTAISAEIERVGYSAGDAIEK
jgi:copper chaperone CopZ